jgi:dihydroxy-acid dehydratase
MYTANTMASAIEALGLSVPYSSSIPAWDPLIKRDDGELGGLHPEKVHRCPCRAQAQALTPARGAQPQAQAQLLDLGGP